MRMRIFLAYTHLLNFLIGVIVSIYVLYISWGSLETGLTALYLYYVILSFCGVAIAGWIAIDGKQIEQWPVKAENLERRIQVLESKINYIKTTTMVRFTPRPIFKRPSVWKMF